MTGREFLRELVYPVTHGGLAAAILFFAVLLQLAFAAGLLGLWLLILAGAAGAKFLVLVLRARALGVQPPVPDAGLFNPVAQSWTLAAWLLLLGILLAASQASTTFGPIVGGTVAVTGLALFPAAVLRLAVTREPVEMLHPGAVLRIIWGTGPAYGAIFGGTAAVGAAIWLVGRVLSVPRFASLCAGAWIMVTLFSLAGAVFYHRRLELDLPVERSPEKARASARRSAEQDRARVLDHAYGLVSRGNGFAGIAHITAWLERTGAGNEAWQWFFDQLGRWESDRAQVHFARDYIARLARSGEWGAALAVAAHCLGRDAGFRPHPADRSGLVAAARRARASGVLEAFEEDQ